jgi:hypothetical protein
MTDPQTTKTEAKALAKQLWDAERAVLRNAHPSWQMPAWSRAPAWRKHPYLMEANAR